jgi:hypothetical protein
VTPNTRFGTQQVETGKARLRKYVVTETEQVEVRCRVRK